MRGSGIRVLSMNDFDHCPDVKETGRTFLANAKLKARAYARHTGALTLADDSGLMIAALNGKPGVYSARFAGPGCTYLDNNQKVLKLLRNKPAPKRAAKFVSVIAVYDGKKFLGSVKGECRGRIAFEIKGKNGFGYDPVFIPSGFSKTYAQLPRAQKNRISHRGRALRKAKALILRYFG